LRSSAQTLLLQEGWKELFILSAAQYGLSADFSPLLEYHGLNSSLSGSTDGSHDDDAITDPHNSSSARICTPPHSITMAPLSSITAPIAVQPPTSHSTKLPSSGCSPLMSAAHSPALSPVGFGSTGSPSYLHDGSLCGSPRKSLQSISCQTTTNGLSFARTPPSASHSLHSPPQLHSPQTPPNSAQPAHGGLICSAGSTPNEHSRCSCLNVNCGSRSHQTGSCAGSTSSERSNSNSQLLAEIHHFSEILERFKQLNVDPVEFSCLKAIALFKTSKNSVSSEALALFLESLLRPHTNPHSSFSLRQQTCRTRTAL
jgi:hypothetical protein